MRRRSFLPLPTRGKRAEVLLHWDRGGEGVARPPLFPTVEARLDFDPLWGRGGEGRGARGNPPARPKQDQVANKFFGHPNANIVALALRNPLELIQAVSSFCAGGVNSPHM